LDTCIPKKEFKLAQEIIEAPLTGKIIKVLVKSGDTVNEEDTLVVLESMKMENPIVSPVKGIVSKVEVKEGQVVKTGNTIAVIDY
jgi:biotin carboxyl carrier protein